MQIKSNLSFGFIYYPWDKGQSDKLANLVDNSGYPKKLIDEITPNDIISSG